MWPATVPAAGAVRTKRVNMCPRAGTWRSPMSSLCLVRSGSASCCRSRQSEPSRPHSLLGTDPGPRPLICYVAAFKVPGLRTLYILFFFLRFYLFFREGREGDRETSMCGCWGSWPATQACTLAGNRICDTLVRSPSSIH
ncbi:hypothetical protein HJG60_010633 [Phyllostomus discolor]|uniref:Uncharacterized protein n=1 Tax=Phyllostomus discolor TaxID=89673 RepID=A0A834ASE1_9CHIR|nr:hypothetical protein HJG60_010633 [Phyllostomus discolor]